MTMCQAAKVLIAFCNYLSFVNSVDDAIKFRKKRNYIFMFFFSLVKDVYPLQLFLRFSECFSAHTFFFVFLVFFNLYVSAPSQCPSF